MLKKTIQFTGAATQECLAAGRAARVLRLYISADVETTISFVDDDNNVKWRQYVGAKGGQVVEAEEPLFEVRSGVAVDCLSSGAGNAFVQVGYERL